MWKGRSHRVEEQHNTQTRPRARMDTACSSPHATAIGKLRDTQYAQKGSRHEPVRAETKTGQVGRTEAAQRATINSISLRLLAAFEALQLDYGW